METEPTKVTMVKRGRPTKRLLVTDAERQELQSRLNLRKGPSDEKLRIRIVMSCARGESGVRLAQSLQTSVQTVSKWRRRFEAYRVAGLTDAPRPGRPRSVSDEQVQAVIDRVRQTRPANATHWSVRTMSKAAKVSATSVHRIWRASKPKGFVRGLRRGRTITFILRRRRPRG